MNQKLGTADWLALIEAGVTTVGQIMAARAARKLEAVSPELAAMSQSDFDAVCATYYEAEAKLADAAAALVEKGAAEKSSGGGQ